MINSKPQTNLHQNCATTVQYLCQSPYSLYRAINGNIVQKLLIEGRYHPSLQSFSLCSCHKINDEMRLFLENRTLELIQPRLDQLKSCAPVDPCTIVSVGPGGCYQEIVLLTKLAQKHSHIQLVLIDNKPKNIPKRALQTFCNNVLPTTYVNVVLFDSIEKYVSLAKAHSSLKPDVLLGIDLTDYSVDSVPLPDHIRNQIKKNNLTKENTITITSETKNRNRIIVIHTGPSSIPSGPLFYPETYTASDDLSGKPLPQRASRSYGDPFDKRYMKVIYLLRFAQNLRTQIIKNHELFNLHTRYVILYKQLRNRILRRVFFPTEFIAKCFDSIQIKTSFTVFLNKILATTKRKLFI